MPHRRHIDAPSYLAASGCAAVVNFPLWKASAIAQSGFSLQPNAAATASSSSAASATGGRAMLGTAPRSAVTQWLQTYKHAFSPPYRGVATVLIGMTWARAAIFYGSDAGRQWLSSKGAGGAAATVLPPMAISTAVQCINMPIVRASITLQNPAETEVRTTWQALKRVAAARGAAGLWHGTSAGIAKTVPKYCTSVIVKDVMEDWLTPVQDKSDSGAVLQRSAIKSVTAGLAGAVLTNPMDVVRNEMFKTELGLVECLHHLRASSGWAWLSRGMAKNLTAVAVPISCTIFLTDAFTNLRHADRNRIEDED